MRGNTPPLSSVPQATFQLRVLGNNDPGHALVAQAQLDALRRLLLGGDAR
jgi:hypothetical protein